MTGRDPALSVVDERGRVHGLENVFVADGSVLPRSSRVNPALTIYAWALRLASLIANERREGEQPRGSELGTMRTLLQPASVK
jgi:choline dehydrogenase-like flavoprotein